MRGSQSRRAHGRDAVTGGALGGAAAGSATQTAPLHPPQGAGRDARLRLSRRADWRFLLPAARLGHVALLGDEDHELADALRLFATSLSLLDLGWRFPSGEEPRFDVVVLRSPHLADACRAEALVEPGGCLYWEIVRRRHSSAHRRLLPGRWRRGERGTPLGLGALGRRLERLGFTAIQFHWHRPDFRAPLEIVPLDDAVLRYVLGGHAGKLHSRVRRLAGRLLCRAGALQLLAPCLSVVACKTCSTAPEGA